MIQTDVVNKPNTLKGGHTTSGEFTRRSGDSSRIHFGYWYFDADSGDLNDGKTTLRLEPQVAKLLQHFLTHQHKVISREELIVSVWDNRVVSDDAINRGVSILRQTLSPDDKQAYIETIVRKGYLAHFPSPPVNETRVAKPSRLRIPLLAATAAIIIAAVIYLTSSNTSESNRAFAETASTKLPVVAVLPFVITDQTQDSQFFANGMHDDLLTQLAKLDSLHVISRTSVMEYQDTARNMREIGQELGADTILEGRVQILNNRIRINAQLIDARTDQHLWAESYDRELSPANLFAVQREIAQTIARQLRTTLTTRDNKELNRIPTENMAAYRAFHRAKRLRDVDAGAAAAPAYLSALEEAVALDPMFSAAWAELVVSLTFLNIEGRRPEMMQRAEQALEQLKAIAPGSVDDLVGQAAYFYYALKDYDRAHEVISLALQKSPSNTRAVELRSWIERRQGNYQAFLNSRTEARKLDPRNPRRLSDLLAVQLAMHRYDEAGAEAENSHLDNFTKRYVQSFVAFRDHRDFKRLQQSIQELCPFYPERDCGWIESIAQRDYRSALAALDEPTPIEDTARMVANDRRRLFTYWLMRDVESLALWAPRWRAKIEEDRDEAGNFYALQSLLGLAMLAAIQDKPDEAKQWVDHWFQIRPIDWAERALGRDEACRVLGMIGATSTAVKCIRDGLEEPSFIAPFFEPYLPFYDSIRNEPEFIDMLADIDGVAGNTP